MQQKLSMAVSLKNELKTQLRATNGQKRKQKINKMKQKSKNKEHIERGIRNCI